VPYLSGSEVMIHKEALYQVYVPLPSVCLSIISRMIVESYGRKLIKSFFLRDGISDWQQMTRYLWQDHDANSGIS